MVKPFWTTIFQRLDPQKPSLPGDHRSPQILQLAIVHIAEHGMHQAQGALEQGSVRRTLEHLACSKTSSANNP